MLNAKAILIEMASMLVPTRKQVRKLECCVLLLLSQVQIFTTRLLN
jgi:hypothetical protein